MKVDWIIRVLVFVGLVMPMARPVHAEVILPKNCETNCLIAVAVALNELANDRRGRGQHDLSLKQIFASEFDSIETDVSDTEFLVRFYLKEKTQFGGAVTYILDKKSLRIIDEIGER